MYLEFDNFFICNVYFHASWPRQGSKIVLVRSYLRVPQAARQVNILIFLVKIKFSPCMPINFVMQGKCLFSDISRPARTQRTRPDRIHVVYFEIVGLFDHESPLVVTSKQSGLGYKVSNCLKL